MINEIVRGFPVLPVLPVRRRRLRDRVDGDHQGRAQSRRREEVRRLGADARSAEDRARRQGIRDPDQPQRRRCRRRCRSSPTSRSSTTTSRSTARATRASACSSAGRRKSTPCAALTRLAPRSDVPSPRVARVARRRRARISRSSRGTRCRTRCSASAWLARLRRQGQRARRSCRRCCTAARGCCRSALLLAARLRARCPRRSRGARAPTALIALGAPGFVYLLAQGFAIGPRGFASESLAALFGALRGGQFGIGLGAALVGTAFAMLFALGLAERGYFKGDAFVAGSVVAVDAAGGGVHVLSRSLTILVQALAGQRRRVLAAGVRRAALHAKRSGASAASPATRAAASRGTR